MRNVRPVIVTALSAAALLWDTAASAGSLVKEPCPLPPHAGSVALADEMRVSEAVDQAMRKIAVDLDTHFTVLRADYARLAPRAKTLDAKLDAFNKSPCASVKKGSPEEATCLLEKGKLVGEWGVYEQDRVQYETERLNRFGDAGRALDAEAQKAKERAERTRELLVRIPKSNATWQKDIEDWTELKDKAREAAIERAVETGWKVALSAILINAKAQKVADAKLWEESIVRGEAWYKSYGQLLPEAQRANALQIIRSIKSGEDFINFLTTMKGLLESVREVAIGGRQSPRLAIATAMVGMLEMEQGLGLLPELPFTMGFENGRMIIDVSYGWAATLVAKGQIEDLVRLEEQSLKDVNRVSTMYVDEINARKIIERMRTRLTTLQTTCPEPAAAGGGR
ncbi:MAG: hypothetical protein HY216_17965 [Candidatus Rokubacteria bacterium]|nr:hypothetical protein [Candidatus Rokubacteria bacterium]